MAGQRKQKYGQHEMDRRGRRGSAQRTPAELRLDDRYRRAFCRLVTPEGRVPSRAVQEIREGKQAPWRPNARRVLELLDAGMATTEIKAVVLGEMDRWIDEEADARRRRPAA